ncbi:hypothetical protein HD554DRAFT_633883 [Boletus coccyginus]|nr:hypothetical protein HD554DRAFT_633883 [Boletus coccyginus]
MYRSCAGARCTFDRPHLLKSTLDNCDFYVNCLESRYQCGPSGYPLGYGQHYCQKFSNDRGLFNTHGRQWMTDTMHCLQLALVEDTVNSTPPASDCQALKYRAFASHSGCYARNGLCTLGVHDWAAVLEIVGVTTLFSSWDAFKATMEAVMDCGAFYAHAVTRGLC